jgi:hypothetical protein
MRDKLILILTIVNSLAILFLCYYAYSQIDSQLHMWDMFQDFERLLIEILTGRMETKDVWLSYQITHIKDLMN